MTDIVERIATLAHRDFQSRFAGGLLGYLWAFVNPLAWIVFVTLVFNLLHRSPPINISPELFVATGIVPYVTTRQTIGALSRTLVANRHLLYVKPVQNRDLLASTSFLELVNILVVSLAVFGGITLLREANAPDSLGGVVSVLFASWFLASGFGMLLAPLTLMSDTLARSIPILLRPMFWVSGVFYTATEIPGSVVEFLWYSPTLHISEALREQYFMEYTSPIGTLTYPFYLGLVFMSCGLLLSVSVSRKRLSRYES